LRENFSTLRVVFSLVLFIFNPPSILQEKRSGTVRKNYEERLQSLNC
jgi:hypothetical protein